jgi:hypothetical protein
VAREVPWIKLVVLGLLGALVTVVIVVVRGGTAIPDEVQPIVWHRQACAHCGMLVGEPRHAAQLITSDGDVLAFDDPGCALRYLDERRPRVHRLWFHGEREWIPADHARFTVGGRTPMGSGLVAVEDGGAIDLAAAKRLTTSVQP